MGHQMERQKKSKKKYTMALNGRRLIIFHTTTNQKQAAETEGSMKGRYYKREEGGKHGTIPLGVL
jgi:hypothetical protein